MKGGKGFGLGRQILNFAFDDNGVIDVINMADCILQI